MGQNREFTGQVESLCGRAIDLLEQIHHLGINENVDDLDDVIPWDDMFDLLQDYDEEVRRALQKSASGCVGPTSVSCDPTEDDEA